MSSKNRTMALYCIEYSRWTFHPGRTCRAHWKRQPYTSNEGGPWLGGAWDVQQKRYFFTKQNFASRVHSHPGVALLPSGDGRRKYTSLYTHRRKLLHLTTRLNGIALPMSDALRQNSQLLLSCSYSKAVALRVARSHT